MKNVILGAAGGYSKDQLANFIISLRKFYDDDIYLIIENQTDDNLKKFFLENKINTIITKFNKKILYKKRYEIYLDFLKKNYYDYIFISDTRDVIFQKNPFDNTNLAKLIFFLEDKKIQDCKHNSRWIRKLYSNKDLEKIKSKNISCSGTTIGEYNYIKKYLELMVQEINSTKYFSLTNSKGTDQGNHNYIVHNNFILESTLLENQDGYIATLANSEPNNFIYDSFLKSLNGKQFNVVHQYDRFCSKSEKLSYFFKNYLKNL